MVPPPSVVVVVVVVLEVCAQANGATTASAMLSIVFFILSFPLDFFPLCERQETTCSPRAGAFRFLLLRMRGLLRSSCPKLRLSGPSTEISKSVSYLRSREIKGKKMRPGVGRTELTRDTSAPRTKRRLNGMGTKAGIPDRPIRGQFMRTIALIDAALRVWEAKKRLGPVSSVWRRPRNNREA